MLGLAITTPGEAPGASDPSGPMFASTPWSALEDSAARKLDKDPVALGRWATGLALAEDRKSAVKAADKAAEAFQPIVRCI